MITRYSRKSLKYSSSHDKSLRWPCPSVFSSTLPSAGDAFSLSKFNNCNPRRRKELLLFSEKEAIRDGDRGENRGKMSPPLELSKRGIDTRRYFPRFFHERGKANMHLPPVGLAKISVWICSKSRRAPTPTDRDTLAQWDSLHDIRGISGFLSPRPPAFKMYVLAQKFGLFGLFLDLLPPFYL